MSFRLNLLANRRNKIIGVFTKMINRLEKTNEKLYELQVEALEKADEQEIIASHAKQHLADNKKLITKLRNIVE